MALMVSIVRNIYQHIDRRQLSDVRAENQRLYRLILQLILDLNDLEDGAIESDMRRQAFDETPTEKGGLGAELTEMKHYKIELRQTTGGWIWELYDGVSPTWVESAGRPFKTPQVAARDGAKARARHEQLDRAEYAKMI
jgi:hypothetical protein